MRKVEATILFKDGSPSVTHTQRFPDHDTAYIRRVFNLFTKEFGQCKGTEDRGGQVVWTFDEVVVYLSGDVRFSHGVRSCGSK